MRARSFESLIELFADDAVLSFEGRVPARSFAGRDAIRRAFEITPPDDELVVTVVTASGEGGEAKADYAWRSDPTRPGGTIRLSAAPGSERIAALRVAVEPVTAGRAGTRLSVVTGDITRMVVDAIVNAANERLLGGGGVDGAIHAAAGPELLAACRALPEARPGVRCPTGSARITPGFRLAARFVVHTVGPVWSGGSRGEAALLASSYHESLAIAAAHGARSIAFPAIATGVYGYPMVDASAIAVRECRAFLDDAAVATRNALEAVFLVAFRKEDAAVLRRAVEAGG